ncbi:MAG: hypothetical protein MI824_19080 [Hyphomicrobiales bacterium]|nr:hypothetical protein [Hyphomicrobiales bacterium]
MSNRIAPANWRDLCFPANEPALICREARITQPFHYWRGATGQRYLHTVYALIECPEITKANFILVRREADGSRTALLIGQTLEEAGSLNLALLRHRGALLGANEIHIHLLADSSQGRTAVEADLKAAQLGPRVPKPANQDAAAIAV